MVRGADRATSPRALRREATKAALLAAASTLAERGEDPLDPALVASLAGVSRPLWYRYFPTRGDFVEAILASMHAAPPRPADAGHDAAADVLAFFVTLAKGLDANAALARVVIPVSHLPGPVADARAQRRLAAIERVAQRLPADVTDRGRRAAFVMDAFLGMQLAWSKGQVAGRFADRVRQDLPWAIRGALAGPGKAATAKTAPRKRRGT
jgi:AcrR family transcriptional regulator